MLAINYSTARDNLKNYCDQAVENNETIVITRKDEKNVVILSQTQYNILAKRAKNAQYLDMIDQAIQQLTKGQGTKHDLIEVDDE